jgi:hypothetical protein
MTEHEIAKRNGVNRAERNSILGVEEAAWKYLRGEPRTLRLLLERFCDNIEHKAERSAV